MSGRVLTTLSSAVGALEGAVVALALVVAAVAGVDCGEVRFVAVTKNECGSPGLSARRVAADA